MWKQQVTSEEGAIKNWANRNKLGLTPKELSSLLGVRIQEDSTVKMVIFPKLGINSGDLCIEVASDHFAHQVLTANLREPDDEEYLSGWLDLREVSDQYLIKKKKNCIIL